MTSKSPVRSAEDVDEQALSYAEIKALASGNPMIKEKMDLDIEVSKLKLLKANHLSQKYALEDAISKGFPKQIAETQARIAGYGADIAIVKENTHPNADGFSPLTLAGATYAEKKEAGAALLTMCQTMLSPEATQIGSYRGLTLELAFDGRLHHPAQHERSGGGRLWLRQDPLFLQTQYLQRELLLSYHRSQWVQFGRMKLNRNNYAGCD